MATLDYEPSHFMARSYAPMSISRSPRQILLAASVSILPVAALTNLASAQDDAAPIPSTIQVGRVVADTLGAGGPDYYTMEMPAGSLVAGVANQVSVDVVVRITGPDGETIDEIDGPALGPEQFAFRTKSDGEYRFEIEPFEGASGDYTLEIVRAEPFAADPEGKVDQMMWRYDGACMPGVAVGVIKDGELIFAEGYGMANLTHGIPFGIDTPSNIGSTSKQFTAFAIGLLEQQGELSFDDDVRVHLPELPDLGHTVTIRNMLTHTTGYREFLNQLAMGGRQPIDGDYIKRSEILDMITRQPQLQNIPGDEFNYNNSSYSLLTLVVERITDQPFAEWMDEHVFTPLGMDHTLVQAERSMIIPGRATGYTASDSGELGKAVDFAASMGAGGMYSTVSDMALWTDNLHTGALGGRDLIDQMTASFVLNNGEETGYGFGMFIAELDGLAQFHHGGADAAHRAMFMFFPEINAGVIALSNNHAFNMGIPSRVARAFFADDMTPEDAVDSKTEAKSQGDPQADSPSESDAPSIGPDGFEALVGDFSLEEMPAMVLSITRDGDTLHGQATGQPRFVLEPSVGNKFKIVGENIFIEFLLADDGSCPSIVVHQNGQHKANRVSETPWSPTAEEMAAYTGRYFSEELETFYNIAPSKGQLLMVHRRFEVELEITGEHEFTGQQLTLEFVFDEAGEVSGLTANSARTRGIKFVKQD